MEENKVIEVKNVSVLIKDRFLVKNASFSATKGEIIGVLGEDKSGKTSLIKAISGSLPINPNQVYLFGMDIFKNKKVLSRVSTVFDPPVFFKFNTVLNNMKYISALNDNISKEMILDTLKKFGLEKRIHTRVMFLPYHEKKLMALALGLITQPDILLLDEPFKNLPAKSLKIVKSALDKAHKDGKTIIVTSKNFETIQDLCDRYIFMENREIKDILDAQQCESMCKRTTYAFVKVKYPHYAGKLIMDNYDINVKLLDNRVLFEADEEFTAEIVEFLSRHKITIYSAGFINKKAEKIFANLANFYKEEK